MSTTATARVNHRTASEVALFMSFELGEKEWKIAWATSLGERPRCRTLRARDTKRLLEEIEKARGAVDVRRVVTCYEAGRDGFWLHRFLHAHDIENRIVDSASIEVNRRARRQKTDRLDAEKLELSRCSSASAAWGFYPTLWTRDGSLGRGEGKRLCVAMRRRIRAGAGERCSATIGRAGP